MGDKSDVEASKRRKGGGKRFCLFIFNSGTNAAIEALQAMGFTPQQAKKGLAASGNDVERAAAYLLDHPGLFFGKSVFSFFFEQKE